MLNISNFNSYTFSFHIRRQVSNSSCNQISSTAAQLKTTCAHRNCKQRMPITKSNRYYHLCFPRTVCSELLYTFKYDLLKDVLHKKIKCFMVFFFNQNDLCVPSKKRFIKVCLMFKSFLKILHN